MGHVSYTVAQARPTKEPTVFDLSFPKRRPFLFSLLLVLAVAQLAGEFFLLFR